MYLIAHFTKYFKVIIQSYFSHFFSNDTTILFYLKATFSSVSFTHWITPCPEMLQSYFIIVL